MKSVLRRCVKVGQLATMKRSFWFGALFACLALETASGQPAEVWVPFQPPADRDTPSAIDLRGLNEPAAGDGGFIGTKSGNFIHGTTGEPVRFWAVNGPPHELKGAALRDAARMLARRGVNLVRVHGAMCNKDGEFDPSKVAHAQEVVRALKSEGIYTHFSIYFPLWLTPRSGHPWLEGYDGKTHPFVALYFNPRFQDEYRKWWTSLLATPDPVTGRKLVEEPAVMGVEMINEDSFYFWTFDAKRIPDAQLRILEAKFGRWLATRHGSVAKALAAWGPGTKVDRDAPEAGRVGFRPLWAISQQKTVRDQETVQFLYEVQSGFYRGTREYLRSIGFRGVITASNWSTASPEVLGPIEKLSYLEGDFVDRHGYFAGPHSGEASEWSLRDGQVYADRSALRLDGNEPGKPRSFNHPVMDPEYGGRPSMISETTFNRPNRYRTEAPLMFAAYGALQDTDAIVHFAFDGARWAVKPNFFMQPWTLATPTMLGQFPATALIYRKGLIAPGAVVARVRLATNELFELKGTPLPQDASLDELRARDLPLGGGEVKKGGRIDPLVHFVGRTVVDFGPGTTRATVEELAPWMDRAGMTVRSTTRELSLDYGKGVLVVNAPGAQGVCGALKLAGLVDTHEASFESSLELGCFLLVPLDGPSIAASSRLLLQVMSEEKATGFETIDADKGRKKIVHIGTDPWRIRALEGTVRLKRPDAASLTVSALDGAGAVKAKVGDAGTIRLRPDTIYYLIEK